MPAPFAGFPQSAFQVAVSSEASGAQLGAPQACAVDSFGTRLLTKADSSGGPLRTVVDYTQAEKPTTVLSFRGECYYGAHTTQHERSAALVHCFGSQKRSRGLLRA